MLLSVMWEASVAGNRVFDDSDYFSGPPVTPVAVRAAEASLGVSLPAAYVALLSERNGGSPNRRCFPTPFSTSWAPDHIGIDAILGVGGEWGIDSVGLGSRDMVAERGYPDLGVVICAMPSGGHDSVMLDYRDCGPEGEPAVVYVDEDRVPRQIASSFEAFVEGLIDCPPANLG
jgi:SMI1-KNR4 cell-wall